MSLRGWVQDHPRPLESAYRFTERLFCALDPLLARIGYDRVARIILPAERLSKEMIFDCRMCGQCILRLTGMTCPMTCPKLLRNGPCGGVRPGGYCEVYADRRCIWTDAYERSRKMHVYGEGILLVQAPVNTLLQGTSAWINMLTGADREGKPDYEPITPDQLPGSEDRIE
jgi:hypothetical protein